MLVVAALLALAVFLSLRLCQIRVPAPGSEQRQAFFRIWSALGLLCVKINSCQFHWVPTPGLVGGVVAMGDGGALS